MTPRRRDDSPHTRLAALRIAKGVSQSQLAEWTGLSRSTIQRLEAGEMQNPPVRYLTNCALALGAELADVIETGWREWMPFDPAPRASRPGRHSRESKQS